MTTEPDEDVKPPVVVMPDMLPSPNTPGSQYEQKTFLHGITLTQAAQQLTDRGTYSSLVQHDTSSLIPGRAAIFLLL